MTLLSQPLIYHGSRAIVAVVVGTWQRGEDRGAIVTLYMIHAERFERHVYVRTIGGFVEAVEADEVSTAYETGPRRTVTV